MSSTRKAAALIGILFILATVTGVIAAVLLTPILNAPDYLSQIAAHEGQVILSAFLTFIMAMCCAGIGLALFPILNKFNEGLAAGSAGFRLIEAMIQVLSALLMACLLIVGRSAVSAADPSAVSFQAIGDVLKAANDWLTNSPMLICWGIGALMYYFAFYRYRLLPRWLSLWGLIAMTLTIVVSVLVMLELIPGFGTFQTAANMPIALQEMVLAVWLIVKGFNSPTKTSMPGSI
jgi:hypothetical protein